ncbi:MAG: HAD family hydrolase [Erysipelotrichaceae bacterium]|nr:HAD family hydrolase [Erysipelotrichaceae bacterium]
MMSNTKIKALFFDLDGTLLNSHQRISDKTRDCLIQCREQGIQCYISTARPKTLDKMLPGWTKDTFQLFDGGVFCNGACRIYHKKQEYTFIDPCAVKECIEIVNRISDLHFVLQMEDEVHAFNYEFNEAHINEWGLQDRNIVPLSEAPMKKTLKIMIYTNNLVDRTGKLPDELMSLLQNKIGHCTNLYLTDQGEVIMVMPKGVSKYSGIEKIRKHLLLKKEEIALFGDDTNDLEMLSAYPNSVAMGNAHDDIKQIASMITLSNDEDGIVFALQKLLK